MDARQTFDRLTAAVNTHDAEAAARCYGADAVMVSPEGEVKGRDQIAAWHRQYVEAFPDLRITSRNKFGSGDEVADEWSLTGTNTGPLAMPDGTSIPATGKSVSLRGCDAATVKDGQIVNHRLYYDQLEMLTQLGLTDALAG
jgi:steroid delta-isomerase-like uncharacterized protein